MSEMETKREHNATIRKAFRENDENCDGMLSRHEFLRMHLIMHDMATGDRFDSMMRQFDIIAGEDSRISKREFAAYYLYEL
jgi:Ca2+-binding EF-hand superfamily protein